ncbi:hypothetical protein L3Q67_01000 [Saccharothrix sp. AJ9571]|nr:hypothetical protein L3Q67_01000 [Saccharothrix sp. AJ9571]
MTQREKIAIAPTGRASRMSIKPVEVLAAHRTISGLEVERYQAMAFDPGGAGRNVILPAASGCRGVFLYISNTADAAEILTVQNASGATVVTPTQAESALVWCDGTSWYGLVGAQS